MARFEYDLHVHTTASDGVLTPAEVVSLARLCGLRGIAITDHDTVEGLLDPQLFHLAAERNIQLISGIEINTDFEDEEVHILGYFINVQHTGLLNRLKEIKQARLERTAKIIDRLHNLSINIDPARVRQVAGSGTVGRPHIAQVMIENGYAATIKEVFEKYLGRGKPAYVPRYRLLPREAINLIKLAGGVPVLAHPGLIQNRLVIDKIMQMGIKGLEVFYPEHTGTQINQLLNLAVQKQMMITGGSDFHGTENTRNQMGCAGLDALSFQQFIQRIQNSD
jgi:predicted metal-dependent phosphoesterase TrpH